MRVVSRLESRHPGTVYLMFELGYAQIVNEMRQKQGVIITGHDVTFGSASPLRSSKQQRSCWSTWHLQL